jgi:hypothetical protein
VSEGRRLEKIGEIELDQRGTVQVARNGRFCLVERGGVDVYGTPWHRVVDTSFYGESEPFVDDLIQVIGWLLTERQGRNDSRRAGLEES